MTGITYFRIYRPLRIEAPGINADVQLCVRFFCAAAKAALSIIFGVAAFSFQTSRLSMFAILNTPFIQNPKLFQ
jgi:hypothetical protein